MQVKTVFYFLSFHRSTFCPEYDSGSLWLVTFFIIILSTEKMKWEIVSSKSSWADWTRSSYLSLDEIRYPFIMKCLIDESQAETDSFNNIIIQDILRYSNEEEDFLVETSKTWKILQNSSRLLYSELSSMVFNEMGSF